MGVELPHESDGVLFWAFLIVDIEEYRTQVNPGPGAYFRYCELLIEVRQNTILGAMISRTYCRYWFH